MSKKTPIRIYEYGSLYEAGYPAGEGQTCLAKETFDNLWNFILADNRPKDAEAILTVHKKGKYRIIKARKYVGTIQTTDGQFIEILPKIYKASGELESDARRSRDIFLTMLRHFPDAKSKTFQFAGLDMDEDFPILEIYISNYLREVEKFTSIGISKDYRREEDNKRFLKGQLMVSKHIIKNICDKTRFYVRSEEYSMNIPHNRIIVSTLEHLLQTTRSAANRHTARKLLALFDTVPASTDLRADFNAVGIKNRLFSSYENIMEWSRQILTNNGYTTFAGEYVNQALLFSAEELFQNFIAYLFKKHLKDYTVYSQHQGIYLIDDHMGRKAFRLKPDIYAMPNDPDSSCLIMDTKWKNIDGEKSEKAYMIDMKDIYQLYGYGKKYALHTCSGKSGNQPKLVLIYPYTDRFKAFLDPFSYEKATSADGLELLVVPFDLSDISTYGSQVLAIAETAQKM